MGFFDELFKSSNVKKKQIKKNDKIWEEVDCDEDCRNCEWSDDCDESDVD